MTLNIMSIDIQSNAKLHDLKKTFHSDSMKISDPPGSLPVVDIKRDTQKVADGPSGPG